jgi:hypothetical protein
VRSLPRQDWYNVREQMLALSDVNKQSLELIESALLVICLDDEISASVDDHCLRLLAAQRSVGNRWFDKTCVVIDPKGTNVVSVAVPW